MAVICNTCGLPEDLCACGELEKDSTHIIIRLETRRFRKKGTMIEGLDPMLVAVLQKRGTYFCKVIIEIQSKKL
jgi:translation initiation factor 1 (eIF-1/SUI1)